jgi:hypothetical protein
MDVAGPPRAGRVDRGAPQLAGRQKRKQCPRFAAPDRYPF